MMKTLLEVYRVLARIAVGFSPVLAWGLLGGFLVENFGPSSQVIKWWFAASILITPALVVFLVWFNMRGSDDD